MNECKDNSPKKNSKFEKSFLLRASMIENPVSNFSADVKPPSSFVSSSGMELFDFLCHAELEHYFTSFHETLRVRTIPQIKYVSDADLLQLGFTGPEQRRLWKFFEKYCPQTTKGKLKKRLIRSTSAANQNYPSRIQNNSQFFTESPLQNSNRQFQLDISPNSSLINSHTNSVNSNDHVTITSSSPDSTMSSVGDKSLSSQPNHYHTHHLILPEHLELGAKLGEGEFGKVYQGVWHSATGPIQVAVKLLASDILDTGQMADFLREVAVMHSISHAGIVRLHGIVMERTSLLMVNELAPLRSLLECLRDSSLKFSLPINSLHLFTQQIAEGMAYLERKRLIHRDLAARNILVFSKDRVKISDFGMSKALQLGREYYQTNFNANLKLPMAWCAPECINYLRFTSASDVWAYGVTLWELFSYGFQPWAGMTGEQILDQIDEPVCARLSRPDLCTTQIYELMLNCWEHEPKRRCSFQQITGQLPRMVPEKFRLIRGHTDASSSLSNIKDNANGSCTTVFNKGEIVVLLDKSNDDIWRACHVSTQKVGYFPSSILVPLMLVNRGELSDNCDQLNNSASVFGSANCNNNNNNNGNSVNSIYQKLTCKIRKSKRSISGFGNCKNNNNSHCTITPDMISLPQNDMRHLTHIGSDGNNFGDLAFLRSSLSQKSSNSSKNDSSYYSKNGHEKTNGFDTSPKMKIRSPRNTVESSSSPSGTLTSVSDIDNSIRGNRRLMQYSSPDSQDPTNSNGHSIFAKGEDLDDFHSEFERENIAKHSPNDACAEDMDDNGTDLAYECVMAPNNLDDVSRSSLSPITVDFCSSPPLPPLPPPPLAQKHLPLQPNTTKPTPQLTTSKNSASTTKSMSGLCNKSEDFSLSLFDDILDCLNSMGNDLKDENSHPLNSSDLNFQNKSLDSICEKSIMYESDENSLQNQRKLLSKSSDWSLLDPVPITLPNSCFNNFTQRVVYSKPFKTAKNIFNFSKNNHECVNSKLQNNGNNLISGPTLISSTNRQWTISTDSVLSISNECTLHESQEKNLNCGQNSNAPSNNSANILQSKRESVTSFESNDSSGNNSISRMSNGTFSTLSRARQPCFPVAANTGKLYSLRKSSNVQPLQELNKFSRAEQLNSELNSCIDQTSDSKIKDFPNNYEQKNGDDAKSSIGDIKDFWGEELSQWMTLTSIADNVAK